MTRSKKETKIIALLGSPRKKGNSTLLANQIILGAKSKGATVESIYLNGLNNSGYSNGPFLSFSTAQENRQEIQ